MADPTGRFRHEPIPVELGRETIAALQEEGFHVNCYVNDELYVACMTRKPSATRPSSTSGPRGGRPRGWLSEPPTKLVTIDDPEELDGSRPA